MARLLYNLLSVTLDADIDDNDTTITFTGPLKEYGSTNIATISGGNTLTLMHGYELMHVTAYTAGASTATVTRGVEGSTAVAHNEGAVLRHVATDADYPNLSGYAPLAGATFTGDVIVPDEAYDATAWNGSLEVPTKNAVRDKIETIGSGTVSDTAYGAGWDGDTTTAPSKNAVYDKIETLGGGGTVTIGPATVQTKTTTYTAADHDLVLASASGGAWVLTLPAVGAGKWVTVKKTDSTANAITVTPASGTIDGAATYPITSQYVSRDFVSDGTNWFVV